MESLSWAKLLDSMKPLISALFWGLVVNCWIEFLRTLESIVRQHCLPTRAHVVHQTTQLLQQRRSQLVDLDSMPNSLRQEWTRYSLSETRQRSRY